MSTIMKSVIKPMFDTRLKKGAEKLTIKFHAQDPEVSDIPISPAACASPLPYACVLVMPRM